MEKKIQSLMKNLACTREEAIEVIKQDAEIDKGANLFELTTEQKAAAKKATIIGTKTVKTPVQRKRKENPDKQYIISLLNDALAAAGLKDINIINPERELSFTLADNTYKLVLSLPRKEKK